MYHILFLIYLAAISIFAVIVTAFDKVRASHGGWRVRESSLLLISLLGGSVAMLLTMLLIRHKTRHIKFMLGIPLIIILQLAAAFLVWRLING